MIFVLMKIKKKQFFFIYWYSKELCFIYLTTWYFSVVVWDLANKQCIDAICGNQAQVESAGVTYCVAYSNISDDIFVTGGE